MSRILARKPKCHFVLGFLVTFGVQRFVFILSMALLILLGSTGVEMVRAQSYPIKSIRIVAGETGGSVDIAARLIATRFANGFGQQAIVDNRANTNVAARIVAAAPSDGYTLLFYGSTLWLLPFLQGGVAYDPIRDFLPITLAVSSPTILLVNPSLPVKSVKELIDLAKTKSGGLNYSSGTTGAAPHLAAELFKAMAGVNIVRVPYKGGGPAVLAVISGEVQLSFATAGSGAPHVKSGKLRALAVTSAKPSALFPELPAVSVTLPGYEAVSTYGMFAPAKTPATIIERLNQGIVRILHEADVKEKFLSSGTETVGNSPGQFAASIKSEMARMGRVIKESGIRDE